MQVTVKMPTVPFANLKSSEKFQDKGRNCIKVVPIPVALMEQRTINAIDLANGDSLVIPDDREVEVGVPALAKDASFYKEDFMAVSPGELVSDGKNLMLLTEGFLRCFNGAPVGNKLYKVASVEVTLEKEDDGKVA